MVRKPEIILIAGANGSGKTTFINQLFSADLNGLVFLNADEMARQVRFRGLPPAQRNIQAGRAMWAAISDLVERRQDFMIETTLAGLTYARKIPQWRAMGYHVDLMYLRLKSADEAVARVAGRVAFGGHNIPETDIRRRFDRSWRNLHDHYLPIVDGWSIWQANETGSFTCVTSSDE